MRGAEKASVAEPRSHVTCCASVALQQKSRHWKNDQFNPSWKCCRIFLIAVGLALLLLKFVLAASDIVTLHRVHLMSERIDAVATTSSAYGLTPTRIG